MPRRSPAAGSGPNTAAYLLEIRRRADEVDQPVARHVVLEWILDRAERLRPQAVLAAIPEEPDVVRGADDRRRIARGGAEADRGLAAVGEIAARLMTGHAADPAVRAQPFVKKQFMTEISGLRIVAILVGRIGRELRKIRKRERAQGLEFGRGPLRLGVDRRGRAGSEQRDKPDDVAVHCYPTSRSKTAWSRICANSMVKTSRHSPPM